MNKMKKNLFRNYFSDESDGTKTKFITNRVKLAEKHIPELEKALFSYVDKTAKTRDSSDKLALVLQDYSKLENVTPGFKLQISSFANILLDVGSYRDAQVKFMVNQVLEKLTDYEKHCKGVQTDLKLSLVASEKERTCMRQLKRLRESQTPVREQISLAEAEYLKARGESSRLSKDLEEHVDIFERRRLSSVKETLLAWTLAELHFHSKALELFTEAYRTAVDIDVTADLEEFRNKLRSTDDTPIDFHKSDSILQLISLPLRKKFTGSGIPHPSSSISSLQSSRTSIESSP